jgi:FMN phosphatase YigB (HAD superfamily)
VYQQSVVHPHKIVFDLGGVLLDWRPQVTVAQLAASISIPSAQTDVLFRCIFQDYGRHADWVQFDHRGSTVWRRDFGKYPCFQ